MALPKLLSDGIRYLRADKTIWSRFAALEPWITKFRIDGREYGGWYDAAADGRLAQFAERFPTRASVLELGFLEGGHTFALARMPGVERVVGLEGRAHNIEKAELVRSILGIEGVELRRADLESDDLSMHGSFDVVFSLGVLYHLMRPWAHLRAVRGVSRGLFLWTHYAAENKADVEREGYRGRDYGEHGHADPLSGLSARSFWPTLDALKKMISDAGFATIDVVELAPEHQDGPAVTLAARA